MLTNRQLAANSEKVYKAKWVYWYGTCGYKCTRSLYESKKRQYPNHYIAARASGYERDIATGKWCADCVGLIKSFFWSGGVFEGSSKYASNHCPDVSANGMIALCPQTGPIKTMPDIPGIVVWKPGHIGVHVGGRIVVEMKGFDYDCLRRDVSAGGWEKWGKLPASMISYSDEDGCEITEEPVGQRDLRNGDEGADVKQLQQNLIKLGFSCGKWGADGEFGDCTEQAVEAFQRAHGLAETGVYDAPTRAVMEEALDRLDAPVDDPRDVRIVGGNCYVRTAPNTRGAKLGVAHEGDVLPYQGQTSAEGWHLVIFKNQNGWVSGKYGKLEGYQKTDGIKRGTRICDVSKHQGTINWDQLAPELAFVVIKASGKYENNGDPFYAENVAGAVRNSVPFHVFHYLYCLTETEARRDAKLFYSKVKEQGHMPLSWALDCEAGWGVNDADAPKIAKAFEDELRRLAGHNIKVGLYVAHEKYKNWAMDYGHYDYIWIPRYGDNDGTIEGSIKPAHPCDLWQYTSHGRMPGIDGDVDIDIITGEGHTLEWFLGGD